MQTPTRIQPHFVGLEKPPQLSWYDYAIMLLQIGASIEHALMVQYLYAAYSLRDKPEQATWRKSLLTIAREEMGHLLTVQNILTLMGGAFNLDRGDYPWDVPFEACPFRLERLTQGPVTLLYAARDEDRNNAVALKEWLENRIG